MIYKYTTYIHFNYISLLDYFSLNLYYLVIFLPLLTPFWSRSTEHSSMAPKGSNISLMSGSDIFFDSMPMKSFLSVTYQKK